MKKLILISCIAMLSASCATKEKNDISKIQQPQHIEDLKTNSTQTKVNSSSATQQDELKRQNDLLEQQLIELRRQNDIANKQLYSSMRRNSALRSLNY